MFNISDKVVCVDDKFNDGIKDWCSSLPKKDQVYTIRGIVPNTFGVGVLLVGITSRAEFNNIWEAGFKPERFRKLGELKQLNNKHDFHQFTQ